MSRGSSDICGKRSRDLWQWLLLFQLTSQLSSLLAFQLPELLRRTGIVPLVWFNSILVCVEHAFRLSKPARCLKRREMILDSLIFVALPSFPAQCLLQLCFPPTRPRNRAVCCSRGNGELSGLRLTSQRMELKGQNNREMPKSSKGEAEVESEIWRLFKEAQQNILELNKQRLIAIEELKRVVNEKILLQEKVEKLETEKQAGVGKDQISICSEMLLRIDSMVLTGMIDTKDASEMRRVVMDHRVSIADAFVDILQKNDAVLLAELHQFSDKSKKNGFHIIHISTEMSPLTSFGTVGSFVTGLSRALQRKGNLVEVILPKYATLDLNEVQQLREIEGEYYSYFNGQLHGNRIWTGVVQGIGVTLIQPLYYSSFFNRERRNGYADDFERFMYFSRASLDYIVRSGKQPDVLQIHNWETAIVGPLFWELFVKQGLGGTRILLTCHDYHSQHLDEPEKLALCGLDPGSLHRPDRLQDNTKTHLVNILKGGIVYSNKVMVMSLNHSKGRNVHGLVHGLESTFSTHKEKLVASSHGLDCYSWDPAKDSFLSENYSTEDMKGKTACKVALQQVLGIAENSSMIMVGCILLDVTEVDVENMRSDVLYASGGEVQFVFMGPGKTTVVDRIKKIQGFSHPLLSGTWCIEHLIPKGPKINQNVTFLDSYDEALSHLIFAGSDIFLCQSFYDPVLQVPLKALKYGALPIQITCSDYTFRQYGDNDYDTTNYGRYIISSFGNLTLSQALDEIKKDAPKWRAKVMDAMAKDFSWDAECYDIHLSAYAAIKKL